MSATYEMNPCRLTTSHCYERCEEDDPRLATWSVYRRGVDQLAMWVSDHNTKEEALTELARLQGEVYSADVKNHGHDKEGNLYYSVTPKQ